MKISMLLSALAATMLTQARAADPVYLVEVRQATGGGVKCTSDALMIAGSVPTPTGQLASALVSIASGGMALTNPAILCQIKTELPTSLQSQYAAYETQAVSWYSAHSSEVSSLASECSTDSLGITISVAISAFESYTASGCKTTAVSTTTALSTATLATVSNTSSTTPLLSPASRTQTVAAVTQTAAAVAERLAGAGSWVAAAGFMGAVGVL